MNRKIDHLDRKIIEELSKDSRQSFRKMARKLRVSIATVINRAGRLEKEGIIRGYTLNVDTEKLGYDLVAVIEISVSKGKLIEVEKQIATRDNVTAVYDITGQTDAVIIAKFESRRDLNDFVKSLLAMDFVEHSNTRLVLNTIKEETMPQKVLRG